MEKKSSQRMIVAVEHTVKKVDTRSFISMRKRHEIFWTRLVAMENHLHDPSFDFHKCFDTLLRHVAATRMAVDEE